MAQLLKDRRSDEEKDQLNLKNYFFCNYSEPPFRGNDWFCAKQRNLNFCSGTFFLSTVDIYPAFCSRFYPLWITVGLLIIYTSFSWFSGIFAHTFALSGFLMQTFIHSHFDSKQKSRYSLFFRLSFTIKSSDWNERRWACWQLNS